MTSPSPASIRLHITPFNPELLPLVLPPLVRSLATDISFHGIPTFPENNYGYVTLPAMEADKIKKKLNGSILKGRKFKVDPARPHEQAASEDDQVCAPGLKPHSSKKSRKRKAEDKVLDGYELPSERKVKRGWTESTDDQIERRKKEKMSKDKEEKKSKVQVKSKYTEKTECLFRTNLPPNKSTSADEKTKKQSKKKSTAPRESVIHEFSQTTTHPSFLRSDNSGNIQTTTFEEGKGWVDESGAVKEPAIERVRKDRYRPGQIAGHKEKPKQPQVKSATSAEMSLTTKPKDKSKMKAGPPEAISSESEDWTSSSGSSSEDDSTDWEGDESVASFSASPDENDSSDTDSPLKKQHQVSALGSSVDGSQGTGAEFKSSIEGQATKLGTQSQTTEVHPLEALFKRPIAEKRPDAEAPAQFSFFGQEDADFEEAPKMLAHLTPFTKRDLQGRGLRSAAPTPDTSQVTRTINWNPPELSEHNEAHIVTESPVPKLGTSANEESGFAKWFWENRGDNNRAWKKRRPPASFCKCTCFSNSTIIPLDPDKGDSSLHNTLSLLTRNVSIDTEDEKRAGNYRSLSCNDCNRKFCLGYDLPTCKGAKEEDVFTTCFQRDSRKDEAIVFIFIIATGGLLLWAVFRPWIQRWLEV
ncbi:hypothetical protein BJX70DRAFT_388994 [Aspergillus crustosus]